MELLFLCIVVITSVNGKEKAGGMCNGSSNDFNTGSRSSGLKPEVIYRDHDPVSWNDAGGGTWIECRVEKRKEMK